MAFWWRHRKAPPDALIGAIVGLQATLLLAVVGFIPLFVLGGVGAAFGSTSWLFGVLFFLVASLCLKAGAAAVIGGVLATSLFEMLVPLGRGGILIGTVLAFAAIALPIGAAVVQVTEGAGLIDYLKTSG